MNKIDIKALILLIIEITCAALMFVFVVNQAIFMIDDFWLVIKITLALQLFAIYFLLASFATSCEYQLRFFKISLRAFQLATGALAVALFLMP